MNPYFAPLMAYDLTKLPDAYIFTAQYDVLRDDGILYANRLKKAGVKVTHGHSKLGFHGIFAMQPDAEPTMEFLKYYNETIDFLIKRFEN